MEEYKKIKTVNRLSQTTQDILHLINEFGKYHNFKENVKVHFIDDQLQKTETDTCRSVNSPSSNKIICNLSTLSFRLKEFKLKKNFMILNEPLQGRYTIEVPSRKEYHF